MLDKNLNIIIRFSANNKIGTGHFFHSLNLFKEFKKRKCNVIMLLKNCDYFIEEQLNELKIKYLIEDNKFDFSSLKKSDSKNIFINDILDTSAEEIIKQKNEGFKVVNIEDRGSGSNYADLIINALYDKSTKNKNEFNGHDFTILRDSFAKEKHNINYEENEKIIISFGGTDPSKLTEKSFLSLEKSKLPFLIIEPPFRETNLEDERVLKNVNNIETIFSKAKIGITSMGRTLLEFLYLGIPILSIAQHAREAEHSMNQSNLIKYLGVAEELEDEKFFHTVKEFYENQEHLTFLNKKISNSIDGLGLNRVCDLIINI